MAFFDEKMSFINGSGIFCLAIKKTISTLHFWSSSKSFAIFFNLTFRHHQNRIYIVFATKSRKIATFTQSFEMHHLHWISQRKNNVEIETTTDHTILWLFWIQINCKCKCNAIPNTNNWIFGSWTRRNITLFLYVC